MYWRDVVILRAVVTDTDADGYPAEVVKETRVFADVQSVKRTEFYAAKQIGIDLAITVKVRYGDYGNQERLLFSGKNTRSSGHTRTRANSTRWNALNSRRQAHECQRNAENDVFRPPAGRR